MLFCISYRAGALICRRDARSSCLWNPYSGRVQRHQFRPGRTDNRTHLHCEVALDELAKHYSARSSCVCGLYSDVASSSHSRDQKYCSMNTGEIRAFKSLLIQPTTRPPYKYKYKTISGWHTTTPK